MEFLASEGELFELPLSSVMFGRSNPRPLPLLRPCRSRVTKAGGEPARSATSAPGGLSGDGAMEPAKRWRTTTTAATDCTGVADGPLRGTADSVDEIKREDGEVRIARGRRPTAKNADDRGRHDRCNGRRNGGKEYGRRRGTITHPPPAPWDVPIRARGRGSKGNQITSGEQRRRLRP